MTVAPAALLAFSVAGGAAHHHARPRHGAGPAHRRGRGAEARGSRRRSALRRLPDLGRGGGAGPGRPTAGLGHGLQSPEVGRRGLSGLAGGRHAAEAARSLRRGAADASGASALAWLRKGFLTNLLNPKVGVFYVSFLPQFLPAGVAPAPFIFLLASLHVLMGLVWFAALIAATRPIAKVLKRPAVVRWLDRATGLVFLGFRGEAGARASLDRLQRRDAIGSRRRAIGRDRPGRVGLVPDRGDGDQLTGRRGAGQRQQHEALGRRVAEPHLVIVPGEGLTQRDLRIRPRRAPAWRSPPRRTRPPPACRRSRRRTAHWPRRRHCRPKPRWRWRAPFRSAPRRAAARSTGYPSHMSSVLQGRPSAALASDPGQRAAAGRESSASGPAAQARLGHVPWG